MCDLCIPALPLHERSRRTLLEDSAMMSDNGSFLATLAKHRAYLLDSPYSDDPSSAAQTDVFSSPALLFSQSGTSKEIESYLVETQSSLEASQEELVEQRTRLLDRIEQLLGSLERQKAESSSAPEEIETTEDALMDLSSQLLTERRGAAEGGKAEEKQEQQSTSTLMNTLDMQIASLNRLYAARDYLSLLAKAEDLCLKAVAADLESEAHRGGSRVESGGEAADSIAILTELNNLHSRVRDLLLPPSHEQQNVESIKAITFIKSQRSSAFSQLAALRRKRLGEALEEAGWPPAPKELEGNAAARSPASQRGAGASPSLWQSSKTVRARWKELMKLQRQSEKLQILPHASSRLDNKDNSAALKKGGTVADVEAQRQPGSPSFQPLLACQCLLQPLLLRFYYHFDSSRSTNRLDKPEWYLTHMLNIVRSHAHLFEPLHGPVASLCANRSSKYVSGMRFNLYAELLHGIMRPLVLKVESSISLLLENGRLLSHTIMQAVQFDQDLRDILPATSYSSPVNLAGVLLSNEAVFEAWVQSEREFANQRLEEELDSGLAWVVGEGEDIDHESQQDSWAAMVQEGSAKSPSDPDQIPDDDHLGSSGPKMKTTRSARAVVALLDGLTRRYQSLPSLSLQLPFLLIQLSVLQGYAQRLDRSLDAFESMSSAFSRALPGAISVGGTPGPETGMNSDGDMVRGLRGLGRLLKACLSALYIARHLSDLSGTSFYLEVASQMHNDREGLKALAQFRAWQGSEEEKELDKASLGELVKRGWRSGGHFAGGLRPLKNSTSSPSSSSPVVPSESQMGRLPQDGELQRSPLSVDVWKDMRVRFERIVKRAQTGIEKLVVSEVLEGLRAYAHRDWDEEEVDEEEELDNDEEDVPTRSILSCLSLLSIHLTHLIPSLPKLDSNIVYRNIANAISASLVDRVVLTGGSHRFSERGAQRFRQDVLQGWMSVVHDVASAELARLTDAGSSTALGRRPEAPWQYLLDVSVLLSLPTSSSSASPSSTKQGDQVFAILFRDAVDAAFNNRWEAIRKRLQIDDRMDLRLVQEILRRRIDCPR